MHLQAIDWAIVVASIAVCFVPALFFAQAVGQEHVGVLRVRPLGAVVAGGLSMVATTFCSDTPNLVTNFVRRQGVAGNWQWWAFVLTGVATVFFYAQLWRRSGVMTDLEFYELRYSGKAASFVRGFRAVYLGLFFNCMIMASVNLAACKIAAILFGLTAGRRSLLVGLLNVVFAAHSGLWGVLVIDMIQFFIKMSAVIAAAYFAVKLPEVGGLSGMVREALARGRGPAGSNYLTMLPDFTSNWDLAVAVFIMPHRRAVVGGLVSGRRAGRRQLHRPAHARLEVGEGFAGGRPLLQRRPLRAAALAVDPRRPVLADRLPRAVRHPEGLPQRSTPALIGHDIAYPAMLKFLPVGCMGLMVGGLIAANSSTILTHLNWGASYLVHDFYRRFIRPGATEKHYVFAGRVATVGLFLCSAGDGLPARHGEGQLQPHPPDRRGDGAALPAALVLVADQRLVRGRGHGQLVRDLVVLLRTCTRTGSPSARTRSCCHHRSSPPSAGWPPRSSPRRPTARP